jgi:RNA polymerase sigma-70 factor (ECF subfamily)
LLPIARHTAARSAARRPRIRDIEDGDAVTPRPGLVHSALDEAVLLRGLVANLDTDRRDAFVLTQLLDLSYAEAAQVCGCPTGTIRSRVARARAREDLIAMHACPDSRPRRVGGT